MKSIKDMVMRCYKLRQDSYLTAWEEEFIGNIYDFIRNFDFNTSKLSGKQVEIIERIYTKYY